MPNIRHAFVSGKADGADTSVVRPSNWNAPLQYTDLTGNPSGTDATIRRKLTGNESFYVRTDGSDSNDGSANDSAHAFLTPTAAASYIKDNIDTNGNNAVIQVADGTYNLGTDHIDVNGALVGGGFLGLEGNNTTPANVTITSANTTSTFDSQDTGARLYVTGCTIINTGGGAGIRYADGAAAQFGAVIFGACTTHVSGGPDGHMFIFADYSISGNANYHYFVQGGATLEFYSTCTMIGTPQFNGAFIRIIDGAIAQIGATFSGSTTGTRFQIDTGGIIQTFGGGLTGFTKFPGNAAGTVQGGFYDTTFYPPTHAKASLPSATLAGGLIYVPDDVGGAVMAFSNGTNWLRVTDRAIIA